MIPTLGTDELLERLASARADVNDAALAFDADGTLWSGDVGEELFEHAITRGWLREEARGELARVAAEHGLDSSGSATALAERVFAAHRAGVVGDVPAFEVMTWAYAGWHASEFEASAEAALQDLHFEDRVQAEVLPVLAWALEHHVQVAVISASPRLAVLAALRVTGLRVTHVAAGVPHIVDDVIAPGMALSLPYGPMKRTAARALFGDSSWLASFGDSPYDLDLLLSARIGVLVRPKPALSQKAAGHPTLCVLRQAAGP